MSWWDRLRGRPAQSPDPSADPQPQAATLLATVPVIPEKLSASVYLHDIPVAPGKTIPCWTYVTEGLLACGQKELIFTLRREKGEREQAFPQDPLHLFSTLYQLAEQGKLVDAGGITQFGPKRFFDQHLAYIDPQPLPGIELPAQAITALLVTNDEVAAAQEFGVTRLIARMGQKSGYYPCPPWSERARPGLAFAAIRQSSMLAKMPRLPMSDMQVCQQGGCICVQIRPAAASYLQRLSELPADMPVALLTALDPQANACLTWEPGQRGPQAISPPQSDGSRVAGCFLAIVPGQKEDRGQPFEDGFSLMLTESSWKALLSALLQGQDFSVEGQDGALSASFEWLEDAYYNPIDKTTLSASGGWVNHKPQEPRPHDPTVAARLTQTVLLSPEQEIAANITTAALVGLIKDIEAQVQQVCAQASSPFDLLVQCTLSPAARPKIELATRTQVDQALLQAIYDALGAVPPLQTSQSPIGFHLYFTIIPVSNG